MPDEINMNTSIYNGDPISGSPEQEEAKRARQHERKANLPKFELAKGERFYIPREKVVEINRAYFSMFDEMNRGAINGEESIRSFMESVIFESYRGEIYKMQDDYSETGMHDDCVHAIKKDMMMPDTERKGIFRRRKPNYALQLCQKEAALESEAANSIYREDIARQEVFLYGETDTFEDIYAELKKLIYSGVRAKEKKGISAITKVLTDMQCAYEQSSVKQFVRSVDSLNVLINLVVRRRKRRAEANKLVDRLTECFKREIEERKARKSDITVLRLIAEIIRNKSYVLEIPLRVEKLNEQESEIATCMEEQEASANDSGEEPEQEETEDGSELDELYELESEFDDDNGEDETEDSEEVDTDNDSEPNDGVDDSSQD